MQSTEKVILRVRQATPCFRTSSGSGRDLLANERLKEMNTIQNAQAPVSPSATGKVIGIDWSLANKRDFVFPVVVTLVQSNRDGKVSRTFRASLAAGTLIQPVLNPNDIPADLVNKTGPLTVTVDRDPKDFVVNDNGTLKINEPCTFKSFVVAQ